MHFESNKILEKLTSSRGGEIAIFKNYIYNFDYNSTSKSHWRCVDRRCKGRIESNNLVVIFEREHNHLSDLNKINNLRFKTALNKKAKESCSTSYAILSEVLNCTTLNTIPILINKKTEYKNINNVKKKHLTINNIINDEIPEFLKYTITNEKFIYCNEYFNNEKVIICTTQENISHLENSEVWMCDGTFYCCPNNFYQLFTIFGIISSKPFPLIYCLLPNKTEYIYTQMFKKILSFFPNKKVKHLICDMELAIHNSFLTQMIDVNIHFCYFHYCKSLFKKIIQCGLKKKYDSCGEMRGFFKCITALPFVPVEK